MSLIRNYRGPGFAREHPMTLGHAVRQQSCRARTANSVSEGRGKSETNKIEEAVATGRVETRWWNVFTVYFRIAYGLVKRGQTSIRPTASGVFLARCRISGRCILREKSRVGIKFLVIARLARPVLVVFAQVQSNRIE